MRRHKSPCTPNHNREMGGMFINAYFSKKNLGDEAVFSGCNKSNPLSVEQDGTAWKYVVEGGWVGNGVRNRGTRGFIFPWPRFNFAALIWLRVFVRVSNDLQRTTATVTPCCFSCWLVFFFFASTAFAPFSCTLSPLLSSVLPT